MPRHLTLALLALLLLPASAAAETVVIGDGHVDFGPRYADGRWVVELRDDTVDPPAWRSLDDVVLRANAKARLQVPDAPEFGFLGPPGSTIWLLPQVQKAGVVWPGWNTQHESVVGRIRRELTWTLHGVDGPGRFVLFANGEFGAPEIVFDSRRPFPQDTGVDADTHVHGNWAFGAPGPYRLDIEMTAQTPDGESMTDRATLRVFVGAGDAQAAFAPRPAADRSPPAASSGGSAVPWVAAAAVALVIGGGVGLRLRGRR